MEYRSARSKAEATARMYFLGNRVVEPLGPGSKEKKSSLVALGSFVGLDLHEVTGKHECGRLIAEKLEVSWDDTCFSGGDTVTLVGLNHLVDNAVIRHVQSGRPPTRSLLRDLINLSPAPRWDDNPEDTHMPEDLAEIESSISDAISTLASGGPAPIGVDTSRASDLGGFEIVLADGQWRTPLAAVQGWLHLAEELDEGSYDAFDRSLATLLGIDPTSAVDPDDLLRRLVERLDRAVALRSAFHDLMESESEGASTRATASAQWDEGWTDVEEIEEAETAGPIDAEAKTWPIFQFRGKAIEGDMDLNPSYQRADVWPTADSQILIESILRGIPLPSVILLRTNTDEGDKFEIVDGKQRLTSILRFTASHPKALATVREKAQEWGEDADDLVDLFMTKYPAFKKKWRLNESATLTATTERALYFPFPLRSKNAPTLSGDLEQTRGHYYADIRHLVIQVGNSKKKIRDLFESATNYEIPVITFNAVSPRQIHEVFGLYNKQGKHLNAEEIRNAAFHELDFMRALLATSGDSDGYERVAPFLGPVWDDVRSTGQALASGLYSLPDAGYKRTKTLSWVSAALLLEDENLASRSTATHINNLLKRIQDDPRDPLRDPRLVTQTMVLLDHAVDAHEGTPPEAWASRFRNPLSPGGRWQELQLVASLIGLAAAHAVLGDDLEDVIDDSADGIRKASEGWARPPKTQSKQQWEFIGGVVKSLLEVLDVDVAEADRTVRDRFGSSGLDGLVSLSTPGWWR